MATVVQTVTAHVVPAGTTRTLTFPSAVTAGNTIIVAVTAYDSANAVTWSVTDNKNGATVYSVADYVSAVITGAETENCGIVYIENTAASTGANSFTISIAFTHGDASNASVCSAMEVSGLKTSGSIDRHNHNSQVSSSTSANVANSLANQSSTGLSVATMVLYGGSTTEGISLTGYTNVDVIQDGNSANPSSVDYKVLSATETTSVTYTHSHTLQTGWVAALSTFQDAGGSSPAPALSSLTVMRQYPLKSPLNPNQYRQKRPAFVSSLGATLSGVAGIGSVGSVAATLSLALTGVQGTGSVGSVAQSGSIGLTGVQGTGGVGSVSSALNLALTGVTGTGAVGTVTPGTSGSGTLTGVSGTGGTGSVSPAMSLALTGVSGTGAVGSVTVSSTGALTGVSGTGAVGTVTPVTSGLSGVSATGSAGSVTPGITLALTGVSGTGSVGTVTPFAGTLIALTGVSAIGSVGSVALIKVLVPNVEGVPLGLAGLTLNNSSLQTGTLSYQSSSTIELGSVISQAPVAGSLVFENSLVNLLISSGFVSPTNDPVGGIRLPNLPNKILPPDNTLVDNRGVIATNWWRFLLNVSNQAMGTNQTVPATISIGASPYVFTTPAQGMLLVSGGPVTLIEYSKDGTTWYPTGVTQGQIQMVPNDQVRITYMNAPTLTFFPR